MRLRKRTGRRRQALCGARRGSAMIECAIYFPLIVLAAMAVFILMLNLYSDTAFQAHLHTEVRREAYFSGAGTVTILIDGEERDRYRKAMEDIEISTVEAHEGSLVDVPYVKAESGLRSYGNAMTDRDGYDMEYYGSSYILDEEKCVRWGKLFFG